MDNDRDSKFEHDDGWIEWAICAPYLDAPVQIQRESWENPSIVYPQELPREMNVCGLYWKRTGIYTELESETPFCVQQQQNANCSTGWVSTLLGAATTQSGFGEAMGEAR